METPNIENLLQPGPAVFYFDPGTGERDLGVLEDPPEVETACQEIKYFNNRSGKRRLGKVFTSDEEVNVNFKLKEPVISALQAFFKGGAIETVSEGTGTVTDQPLVLTGETMVSVGKYGISDVVVTNGGLPMTVNVDYIIDAGQVGPGLLPGRIGRIIGGGIDDGDTVLVSYTYTIWESLRFPVAASGYQEGSARIEFFKETNAQQWNFIIPKCQLKPNGSLVYDEKKLLEIPMAMMVLDDYVNNPDAPQGYWECLNET